MNKSSGQTLVEMVVAVGMVALVLVAIVSGIAISIRNSRFSKNKALATRIAQEGIEKLRAYRDEFGWEPFYEEMSDGRTRLSVEYCFDDLPDSLEDVGEKEGTCAANQIIDETYTRYAQVDLTFINETNKWADVVVGVSWIEGSIPHSVELTSRFNNWTRK